MSNASTYHSEFARLSNKILLLGAIFQNLDTHPVTTLEGVEWLNQVSDFDEDFQALIEGAAAFLSGHFVDFTQASPSTPESETQP